MKELNWKKIFLSTFLPYILTTIVLLKLFSSMDFGTQDLYNPILLYFFILVYLIIFSAQLNSSWKKIKLNNVSQKNKNDRQQEILVEKVFIAIKLSIAVPGWYFVFINWPSGSPSGLGGLPTFVGIAMSFVYEAAIMNLFLSFSLIFNIFRLLKAKQ